VQTIVRLLATCARSCRIYLGVNIPGDPADPISSRVVSTIPAFKSLPSLDMK
jgi:hypothetical protein